MDIRIFESREYTKYFIQNAKYDKNIDYWSYAEYIKDEKLRLEYEKICVANGLISLYSTRYKVEPYKGNLYEFTKSSNFKILFNAYKKVDEKEKEILSKVFGIEDLKNISILNKDNNKNIYKLGMRSFDGKYRTERGIALVTSVVKKVRDDYNYYFTLNDKLKSNNSVIQALLENAKYRVNNYGEVLPFVTSPKQLKQLRKIIKLNSYCALYLYIKTGSTSIPSADYDNKSINDILNNNLVSIDKKEPIYKIGKYVLKNVGSEYSKPLNDYIGTSGRCIELDRVLRRFENIDSNEMKKRVRFLSHKALTKHINPIIPIAIIIATGATIAGGTTIIKNSIDYNNAVDNLKSSIEGSNYYLDEYGSVDDNIEENSIIEGALGDEGFVFVSVDDLNSRDKIAQIIASGKKVGLVIRPNTTNFDEFNKNMTSLAIYYNYYENINFPVLYDISVLKDNMTLNCEFANQFLAVMDKLRIKAGLYGDESIFNSFNTEYNKNIDKYKNITSFDNLVILNDMDNLEENMKRLSSKYNASMIQLPDGYIISNDEFEKNNALELVTNYKLGENERVEDVAYKLNLPIKYLCDLNHISNPSDIGSGMAIQVPKSYGKIGKIGPGSPLLANLDDGNNIIKGIDVSLMNGDIDWQELKKQGVGFAVLRVADCLIEEGDVDFVEDSQFGNNLKGCIENDIPYSFYYYTRATTPEEMIKEADFISKSLQDNGIYSGNIFIDLETEKSEHGLNITLDEKIQNCYLVDRSEECISIIDAGIKRFKENGFDLCFYCGETVHSYLDNWFPGSTFWITSHETYTVGIPKDLDNVTMEDGHRFEDFSYSDTSKEYYASGNTPIYQLCEWGKFDNVYNYSGLPRFFDLDYASENFVNEYFYKDKTISIHIDEQSKVR